MKSCLGIILIFFTFIAIVCGGAGVWYLSKTAEFTRTPAPAKPVPMTDRPKTQLMPNRQNTPARPANPSRPLAPKQAPKPAPGSSSSPFGTDTPPEVPR